MRDIPSAIANIDWIIENIDSPDVDTRRDAAAGAQYALLGPIPHEKADSLLPKLAARLELKLNGHAIPVEPDEYVRERCANAFELASSSGKRVGPYLDVLRLSRDRDPHQWVRDMARDALRYCEGHGGLPHPEAFTTRPIPAVKAEQPARIPAALRQPVF
jgi:hypothetical protein